MTTKNDDVKITEEHKAEARSVMEMWGEELYSQSMWRIARAIAQAEERGRRECLVKASDDALDQVYADRFEIITRIGAEPSSSEPTQEEVYEAVQSVNEYVRSVEREACARMCEGDPSQTMHQDKILAQRIRARSSQEGE